MNETKNEEMAGRILTETVSNAEQIEALLGHLIDLVPPHRQQEAERLCNRLEKRMLYQDYLYDCHGALAGYEGDPETDIILDYDEYVLTVTVAFMLS